MNFKKLFVHNNFSVIHDFKLCLRLLDSCDEISLFPTLSANPHISTRWAKTPNILNNYPLLLFWIVSLLRIIKFSANNFLSIPFQPKSFIGNIRFEFLYFCETHNQLSVGLPVFLETSKQIPCTFVTSKVLTTSLASPDNSNVFSISPVDIILSQIVLFFRYKSVLKLYESLPCQHKSRKLIFNLFSVYQFIFYAIRLLRSVPTQNLVVFSHYGPSSNAMVEVARLMNIKTFHIHHGLMSRDVPLVPADYLFLAGRNCLDYLTINYNISDENRSRQLHKPSIFITGIPLAQKHRPIDHTKKSTLAPNSNVLLCINSADNINKVIDLLSVLSRYEIKPILRFHPCLSKSTIKTILSRCQHYIHQADQDSSLSSLLTSTSLVISGESNIQFDAALYGNTCIVFNMSSYPTVDYYGFIKKGLSLHALTEFQVVEIIRSNYKLSSVDNTALLRSFQSSFGGRFFLMEHHLIADLLLKLGSSSKLLPFDLMQNISKDYPFTCCLELKV